MAEKYIDIKEFMDRGYLQELNRQFLHPLGMALAVNIDDNGFYSIKGVMDYRESEEGMIFGEITDEHIRKAQDVAEELTAKKAIRLNNLGYTIQPAEKLI